MLAALVLADTSGSGPYYTAQSIANSAAGVAGLYAPNTFVTIYGQNLAYATASLTASEVSGGMLPTVLGGTGVRVLINNIPANIYYVSPTQVNLLIPTSLIAGPAMMQLVVDESGGSGDSDHASDCRAGLFPIGRDDGIGHSSGWVHDHRGIAREGRGNCGAVRFRIGPDQSGGDSRSDPADGGEHHADEQFQHA